MFGLPDMMCQMEHGSLLRITLPALPVADLTLVLHHSNAGISLLTFIIKSSYLHSCLQEALRNPSAFYSIKFSSVTQSYQGGKKTTPSGFCWLGFKIKALLWVMGMRCRYVGVNNSAWAKSSSEADGYFYVLCSTRGRNMAHI